MAARKALGLEGALVDYDLMEVAALDDTDERSYTVRVAGPAALMVAKMHKLHDRIAEGHADRIADKDAADVYRMMQALAVDRFVAQLRSLLADATAERPTTAALDYLRELFGGPVSQGVRMASESLRTALPEERVAAISISFVRQLREQIEGT